MAALPGRKARKKNMRNSRVTKGLALTLAGAMVSPAAELNVRSVVLYKHGVGYFERSGELGAGESARLDFKAGEMNDVLKSLTLDVKGPPACCTAYGGSAGAAVCAAALGRPSPDGARPASARATTAIDRRVRMARPSLGAPATGFTPPRPVRFG